MADHAGGTNGPYDPYGWPTGSAQPHPQPQHQPGPYGHPQGPYGYGPAQPPYPPPAGQQYIYVTPHRTTNGLAVASMVLGIVWVYWIGSILALVFGYKARKDIRERGEAGDGMAIAGIVLGWVGVGIFALVFFAALASS